MRSLAAILALGCLLMLSGLVLAQSPLGINYQGIARSADGSPLINQKIGLKMSITSGPDGSADYVEEHHVETNEFGLFAVIVGQGQASGSLNDVDWVAGNKWLQIEIDPMDQGDYLLVGTQQMLSVPYALYAAKSGDELAPGVGIDIRNGQVTNTLPDQPITLTGTGATGVTGTYPNFTINSIDNVDDADADPANELQELSITGNTLFLSDGGSVDLSDFVNTDGQNLADVLSQGTDANGINITGLADPVGAQDAATKSYVDQASALDLDKDASNEIQSLSLNTNILTLTSGGNVNLSGYLDNTDNQNLTSSSVGTNRTINISGGTGTTISVDDNDNSATNEIQTITKAGSLVTLSNGGGSFTDDVNDADASTSNELNTAVSYEPNNTLRITDAGGNRDVSLGTLNANLNAGNNRVTNLADPVASNDAVNLGYLEAKDGMDYAISVPISYSSASAGNVALDLSGAVLDKGGLVSGSTITITEAGVYALTVQGFSGISVGSTIELLVAGTNYTVLKGLNNYLGQYLFDLVPGDTIQIIVQFGSTAETINLQISAYKI